MCGGRNKPSVLADVVEALLGAIYLDSNYDIAGTVAIRLLQPVIDDVLNGHVLDDYKSELQNYIQGSGLGEIRYSVVSETGPDHDKRFESMVTAAGHSATGKGRSKKESEQEAARNILAIIKPFEEAPGK